MHVDQRLLHVQRKYAKRMGGVDSSIGDIGRVGDGDADMNNNDAVISTAAAIEGEEKGYVGFAEAARDIESLLDVVWISGTRECLFSSIS